MNVPQDIKVCSKCGVVFDLKQRKNKDCPVCHSGEHAELKYNNSE